jgi:hypothetical protein
MPSPRKASRCFSSVLRSERAVRMNILIMRTFVRLREMIAANKNLAARIEKLEASQAADRLDHRRARGRY